VHAFVVPIRDENGQPLPGIRIEDNGLKLGLNGVDNGRIWFDHVRIPRTELLNGYGDVTPDGKYQSHIESPSVRFFVMIGTLVGGRIGVAISANCASKSALTIAIRYAAWRRQFGPPGAEKETLLLDYPMHQRRLLPLLANVFALDFALKEIVRQREKRAVDTSRQLETLVHQVSDVCAIYLQFLRSNKTPRGIWRMAYSLVTNCRRLPTLATRFAGSFILTPSRWSIHSEFPMPVWRHRSGCRLAERALRTQPMLQRMVQPNMGRCHGACQAAELQQPESK
jgi:hypothetical protein